MNQEDFKKLFELIANEALMGFMAFNFATQECVYANKLAKELLGLMSDKDISEVQLEHLFPNIDAKKVAASDFKPLTQDTLMHEGLYQSILVNKINGPTFIATVGVKQLELIGEKHLLLMLQDTTLQVKLQRDISTKQAEIKKAYEELLEQNEQLKALDKAKDRFISLTTHELRTPVSAMVATSEVLKEGLYDGEEQLQEFITMIYEQGHHLLNLVNDILDFSKIQAGKMEYYIEEKNLVDDLLHLIEQHKSYADSENIKLQFSHNEDDPVLCYYDDLRIKQVISNLLSNAIKYNNPGGSVEVWLESSEEFITCYCKDTGKGIPQDLQSKVFDEFETLGKVALHHEGTGLGMPISKQLMEAMGGNIQLKSQEGAGTTFWIQIPRKKVLEDLHYRPRQSHYDLVS